METSKIDATQQGGTGTRTKSAKSAREAFSDLLLSQFDRIAKGADDETGVDEGFFQPRPRQVSKDLPLGRSEEPAREERHDDKVGQDQNAVPYVETTLEPRPIEAKEKAAESAGKAAVDLPGEVEANGSQEQQAQAKLEAAAQATAQRATQATAQAATQPATQAKPNASAQAPAHRQAQANDAGNNAGAAPQVQVSVGQAPAQAQASQPLANGAAALKAQEIEGGDHGAGAPGATAGANGAATAATGDPSPNGGFDPNGGKDGQPGLGTLAAAIAFGTITAGAAGVAGASSFAAQLDQQALDTPEPLTVGAVAGTTATTATAATAASARRAPEASPQLPRLAAMEQIAINIQKAVSQGKDTVTIQLRPEELGRIDVKLDIGKDGQVQAHVRADKPETLELLQRDARGLERALQDAGLRTDSGSLSFGLRGENRNTDGQTGQQQQQSTRVAPELAADVEAMAPVIAAQSVDGRVDVHV